MKTCHPRLALTAAVLGLGFAAAACGATTTDKESLPPLETVDQVELSRYLGTWYEIASYPQRFQKGCTGTTATYSLRDDGTIDVLNQCFKDSLDGKLDVAEGRARVVDTGSSAKLEVSFFRPFWGDYWIIDLGPEYEYAVVGHPGRDYLWILSRQPQLDSVVRNQINERLQAQHYDLSRLRETLQPTP